MHVYILANLSTNPFICPAQIAVRVDKDRLGVNRLAATSRTNIFL